jgi:hypothetical protein
MADTVESLTAEVARLEVLVAREEGGGAEVSLPGFGRTGQPIAYLNAKLAATKTRLARLEAIAAGANPLGYVGTP